MRNNDPKSNAGGEANRDPITGAPGAHPVGTGLGAAAGGAAAGALAGSVAGPVGTAIGIVAGAVAGGLAGKGAAEAIDPTREDAYWRDNYRTRNYVEKGANYDTYAPAYKTGYEGFTKYRGRKYEDVESDLQREYDRSRGNSGLAWDKARHATRDAWHRVERALPGDADGDGR